MRANDTLLPHHGGPEKVSFVTEIAHAAGYVANMAYGLVQVWAQGTRDLIDPAVSILKRERE